MAKAAEVVVAGHICLDIIPAFTHGDGALVPGALTEVGPALMSTGGAVANTGLALHRLGVATALLGKLGEDTFAGEVVAILEGYEASLAERMRRVAGETTSYTVVISPPGVDRYFLHCPGANATFGLEDVPAGSLRGARLLHFGYPPLMRNLQVDGGEAMRGIFERAHGEGLVTSLDMAAIDPASETGRVDWRGWLARVLPEVDLFVPSYDEVCTMLDGEVPALTIEALDRVGERLLAMRAGIVAIKLGDEGLYLRTGDDVGRLDRVVKVLGLAVDAWVGRRLYVPCYQTEVVGTTGAGDCTIAGLLAALLRGEGPELAIRSAVGVGAASVASADAVSAVPAWAEVERRIERGWASHPVRLALPGWRVVGDGPVMSAG
ncbi:carbohydrate kinase family protein [Mucisphaera sp.]|uniref:carbohydrate kinase family protein n=1 Tax=Mucisphaera sp. TaxID=2913024 RepID=UPI003D12300A